VLDGSTGTDTVSYAYGLAGTTGVTVSLASDHRAGHRRLRQRHLISIENLIGSAYATSSPATAGPTA
jgi:hypothetical protein